MLFEKEFDTENGTLVGNAKKNFITKDDSIRLFSDILPVSGIVATSTLEKESGIWVDYSILSDVSRTQIVNYLCNLSMEETSEIYINYESNRSGEYELMGTCTELIRERIIK